MALNASSMRKRQGASRGALNGRDVRAPRQPQKIVRARLSRARTEVTGTVMRSEA